MMLIAYLIPGLSLLFRGKKLAALICLILQLTIIGWIPAALYAVGNLSKSRGNKNKGKRKATTSNKTAQKKEKVSKPKFICQYCGTENQDLKILINPHFTCHHSPTKNHIAYDKGIQPIYHCKFCGTNNKSLKTLVSPHSTCHKSPNKRHQVL